MIKRAIRWILLISVVLWPIIGWSAYGEIQPDGDSIIHLYHLNNSGSDDGTASLTGSLYGDATWNAYTLLSQGGTFDGTGCGITFSSNFTISTTGNYTISAWIKTSDTNKQYIAERGTVKTATKYYGTGLAIDYRAGDDGDVVFYRNIEETSQKAIASVTQQADNVWHYAVGVFDGTNLELYVDGESQGTLAKGGDLAFHASYDYSAIGVNRYAASSYETPFNGTIDEVVIYNVALTASEIRAIYNYQKSSYGIHTQ